MSKLSHKSLISNYLNPLEIPAIVKIVSCNVKNLTTLKNFRAVNKLWRWESMDQLKHIGVLFLNTKTIEGLVNGYINRDEGEWNLAGKDFKPFFHQVYAKPFQNYRFGSSNDKTLTGRGFPRPDSSIFGSEVFVDYLIWDLYLSRAIFLDIGPVKCQGNRGYQGLKWLLKKCQNLKILSIEPYYVTRGNNIVRYYDPEDNKEHLREENEVVLAPNLESLSLGHPSYNGCRNPDCSLLDTTNAAFNFKKLLQGCPRLKNLWTHSGPRGSENNSPFLSGAIQINHKLESLSILTLVSSKNDKVSLVQLHSYLEVVQPPLKSLVLTLSWVDYFQLQPALKSVLEEISAGICKLELFIDSDLQQYLPVPRFISGTVPLNLRKLPAIDLSYNGTIAYPNLTHLKVSLCYTFFAGNGSDTLQSFDFQSLKQMRSLKEFRFESGVNVERSWVTKEISLQLAPENPVELPDLRVFHWHSKFTQEALKLLGRVMPSLEILEIVQDEESFVNALKTWPNLRQITLLPCSEVPLSFYKEYKENGLVVVNQSRKFKAYKPPRDEGEFSREKAMQRQRLSCFREKAHNVIDY